MKNRSILVLLMLVIVAACQKEVTFDNAGPGSGGGGTTNGECKACTYLPWCDGSIYNYYDTVFGATPMVTADTIQYIKDTTFDGRTYRKLITKGSTTPYYTNCSSGISRYAVFNVAVTGGTVTKIDLRMLFETQPVGYTWNDTISNGFGQTVIYKNKIVEKSVSRTLGGTVFPDVIHVESESGVDIPIIGYMAATMSDYYYAKGVGIVDAIIASADRSSVYEHKVIKAYSIP